MKMISSTRKMSVSGVMLISDMIGDRPRFFRLPSAMRLAAEVDGVEHAVGGDGERRLDAFDAGLEVVVENDRDDGDAEAEAGGDERLRDARRDHREAAAAHHRHVVEGLDDADD